MKKISSILLTVAMLVTMLVPMLAIGVSAADYADGQVVWEVGASDYRKLWYYADEDTAIANGMSFATDYNGVVVYTNNIDTAMAYGGSASNTTKVVSLIVDQYLITEEHYRDNVNKDHTWNYGARTFTLSGNGGTIKAPGRIVIQSNSSSAVLTFANITLESEAYNKKGAVQLNYNSEKSAASNIVLGDKGVIKVTDGNETASGAIIVQQKCTVTLNSGSVVTCNVPSSKVTGNSTNSGIRLNQAGASLVVNEGALIDVSGCAINVVETNIPVTINGGHINSEFGPAYINNKTGSTLTVNGGTFTSGYNGYGSNAYATIWATAKGTAKNIKNATIKNVSMRGVQGKNIAAILQNGSVTVDKCNIEGGIQLHADSTLSNSTVTRTSGDYAIHLSAGGVDITNSTIISAGRGIVANGTVNFKSGKVVAGDTAALHAAGGANITVTNGEFYSSNVAVVLADNNGKVTVNGGTFWSDKNLAGLLVAGSGSKAGGTVTVNGGTYYYTNGVKGVAFRNNESSDGAHSLTLNDYNSAYGMYKLYAEGPSGDTEIEYITTPKVQDGASVRTVKDEAGIRFSSKLEKTVVEYLIANASSYEFGTIIAPVDYIKAANGVFTPDALTAAGKSFLKIKAEKGIMTDENGNYVINAAMINIKANNIDRDFAAIGYLTYTIGEKTYTVYGVYNESNARSILEVANRTLADVYADGDVLVADDPETTDVDETVVVDAAWREANGYVNAVTSWHEWNEARGVWMHMEEEGVVKYSKYSSDQLDVVKSYVPY